jgi:hypothetical protein
LWASCLAQSSAIRTGSAAGHWHIEYRITCGFLIYFQITKAITKSRDYWGFHRLRCPWTAAGRVNLWKTLQIFDALELLRDCKPCKICMGKIVKTLALCAARSHIVAVR